MNIINVSEFDHEEYPELYRMDYPDYTNIINRMRTLWRDRIGIEFADSILVPTNKLNQFELHKNTDESNPSDIRGKYGLDLSAKLIREYMTAKLSYSTAEWF